MMTKCPHCRFKNPDCESACLACGLGIREEVKRVRKDFIDHPEKYTPVEWSTGSKCCNAKMAVHLGVDGTNYWICLKCNKPCDPVEREVQPTGETWKERFRDEFMVDCSVVADQMWLETFIEKELSTARAEGAAVTGETSDGYHTFNELYEFRKLYNALLFNEWSSRGVYRVHKSIRHSDGELCFGGGWFIVVAQLPTGQISNHYELKDWDLFQCKVQDKAETWDGHTEKDVLNRLEALTTKEST